LQGRIQEGGEGNRCTPPLKLEKIWFFLHKIMIFHTKYPNNFRAPFRLAQFFLSAPPLIWNPGSAPAISGQIFMKLPELLFHNYKCSGYVPCCVTVNTHTIVNWKNMIYLTKIKSEKSTFVFKSPENKNHADQNYYQINK
jgi:hypothetical protein